MELHLELEGGGCEGVAPVAGDEVEDGPLLLPGVARLELVERAQVQHSRLLQQQRRLLSQPASKWEAEWGRVTCFFTSRVSDAWPDLRSGKSI